MALRPRDLRRILAKTYPWTTPPLIVGAPMRVLSGPSLAVAVSSAGGLGFIGPTATPADLLPDLETAAELASSDPALRHHTDAALPIGVGFQAWNGDLHVASSAVRRHRPCAAWLFAPRRGQQELDEWAAGLRHASPRRTGA